MKLVLLGVLLSVFVCQRVAFAAPAIVTDTCVSCEDPNRGVFWDNDNSEYICLTHEEYNNWSYGTTPLEVCYYGVIFNPVTNMCEAVCPSVEPPCDDCTNSAQLVERVALLHEEQRVMWDNQVKMGAFLVGLLTYGILRVGVFKSL